MYQKGTWFSVIALFMNVLTAYDKPFHNDQKSSTIVNFMCIMNSSLLERLLMTQSLKTVANVESRVSKVKMSTVAIIFKGSRIFIVNDLGFPLSYALGLFSKICTLLVSCMFILLQTDQLSIFHRELSICVRIPPL